LVLVFCRARGTKGERLWATDSNSLDKKYEGQTSVLDMESPTQVCDNISQRKRRHDFYFRNGFRDTNVYKTYNDITMTIMMIGEGTFTIRDWDEITNELKQFW